MLDERTGETTTTYFAVRNLLYFFEGWVLDKCASLEEALAISPGAAVPGESNVSNPTDQLLLFAPVSQIEPGVTMVEFFRDAEPDALIEHGMLRFLNQMTALIQQWQSQHLIHEFRRQQQLRREREHFARVIHESLDRRLTAYTIANEAKRLIGCDRVSVAVAKGTKCRIIAVSGQDTLDKRSNLLALLGQLATKVVRAGEPLWYDGPSDDIPPQIQEVLDRYVEESFVKTFAILPLEQPDPEAPEAGADSAEEAPGRTPKIVGALIAEQIEDELPQEEFAPPTVFVQQHASRAMANAQAYSNLFLMPLWRLLGRAKNLFRGRLLPKTLAVLTVLVAGILALWLIPADFELEAKGYLQPVEQHDVFAAVKGIIQELHVSSGDSVKKGQLLLDLSNPELTAQIVAKNGELETARKQLHTVLNQGLRLKDLTDAERIQLAWDRDRLEQSIASLQEQIGLLNEQQDNLKVHSPIDGQVVTWDFEKLLSNRPIAEGQLLLTVAKPDGAWQLDLYMPDKRMGHLEDARRDLPADEKLKVRYVLAMNPGTTRVGYVEEIQPAAELHKEKGQSVRIRVAVEIHDPSHGIANPRPGAEVIGDVYCGRRPLGYVWFHEAYEAVLRFLF